MNKTVTFIVLLLFLGLLISCATQDDAVREVPEYSDAIVERITGLIEEGGKANAGAVFLCRLINDARIKDLEQKALDGIHKDYIKAVDDEMYNEAVELLKSLDAAGFKTGEKLEKIYIREILKNIDSGAVTPALALFQNTIIKNNSEIDLADEELQRLIDAAVKNRNKAVVEYLMNSYPASEYILEKKEKLSSIIEYTPDKDELISGTVTIWVNRGIKIENGVGYPDRIIGSGFYIDDRGYLLTNYHVISSEVDPEYEGFSRLYVKYDKNEEKIPATVVGWDASLDIALLKVIYTPEFIYSISNDHDYKPGEKIYAIGSPGGLDKTITSGIISAPGNRRLLPLGDTIQVDVPINSGNSGGPVVDADGNLVGVAFAGMEQFEGVNFIIPVKWITNSIPELYIEGRNRQSWLGLTVHESNEGLEIIYVMPGTSVFTAGLQGGDRLISINGIEVSEIPEAQEQIMNNRPGTLLNINILRDGENINILLKTEERDDVPMEKALKLDSRKNLLAPFLGMAVERGDDEIIGQEYIIKKVYRGMVADETGLSVNDPFSIVNWYVDDENEIIIAGIRIKKRKAGFLETVIQLGSYIDINNTI